MMTQETKPAFCESLQMWSYIVQLLSKNPEWMDAKVKFFLPNMELGFREEGVEPTQRVKLQLQKLYDQGRKTWKSFIHCVCMEQNVPLDHEVMLMSTCGHEDGYPSEEGAEEENQPESQPRADYKRPQRNFEESPPRKRSREQQTELARKYLQHLRTFTQQRCENGVPGPGLAPAPHQVYIPPILQWSQSILPLESQEATAPEVLQMEDGPHGSLHDLFPPRPNKGPRVTVVLGQAGMGKTTLTQRLCQKWANRQLERFQAVFLFEFRLLNLFHGSLTLRQLLFDLYLRPEVDPDEVLQYLEKNAESVLLIFDGLEEALQLDSGHEPAGLSLFSDLCKGTLLPGCQVIATSRPGKLPACVPKDAALVHMWGFDKLRVDQYVGLFFSDQATQEVALAKLQANGSVRNLCAIPALCQVVCLCLQHQLPSLTGDQAATLPPTVTQLYLKLLLTPIPHRPLPVHSLLGHGELALRGLEEGKVIFFARDIPMTFRLDHGLMTTCCVCTRPGCWERGYAFTHFSLQGFFAALYLMVSAKVDKDKLVQHVTLCSRWLRRTNSTPSLLDALPTFLAGLASSSCLPFLSHLAQRDEAWLGGRQAAVVQALKKLAPRKLTGPKLVELCRCVEETQDPELASFSSRNFPPHLSFHNFPLTCADLAAMTNVLGHREEPIHLEFEGCPLEPCSPEALASCGQIKSLRIQSRKCGDTFAAALSRSLPTMGSLKKLWLSGSQITAQGFRCLQEALLHCPQLEEICFQDNQLQDQEVLDMAEGLLGLPRLQKLDLSRKDDISVVTLLRLTKIAVMSPAIRMLQAREAKLVFFLSPTTETATEPQGASDLERNASQKKETQHRSLNLRLQKCQLRAHDVKILITHLQEAPCLEEVDLSENYLEDEGCRLMAEAAARLHITGKLDLSNNSLSMSGLHYILRAASGCQMLVELYISLLHSAVVFSFAPKLKEQTGPQKREFLHSPQIQSELHTCTRKIRLANCDLQANHLKQLCRELGRSSCWGDLDFSSNSLGDKGAAQLVHLLPTLGPLQSVDLSRNGMSLEAVFLLAQFFSTVQWPVLLDIRLKSQHIILKGDRRDRDLVAPGSWRVLPVGTQVLGLRSYTSRSFCLGECQLEPWSLCRLCDSLGPCPGPLELRFSCSSLSAQSLEKLLLCLPRLSQLSLLRLSQEERLLPQSLFLLANFFSQCPRIQKVNLRSLQYLTLHFRSSEEQEGGCYGRFIDCGLSQEHVDKLCRLLSKCEDLRQLDLSANQLGDDGLRTFLKYLPQLPLSGSLDLSHNRLTQEAALDLVDMLPACLRVREASVSLDSEQRFQIHFSPREETGKTVRLSQCNFRPEHVSRLATSLSQALQLTDITLTHCNLGPEQLTLLLCLVRPQTPLRLRVMEPWVGSTQVSILLDICAQASGNITEISLAMSLQQLCLQLQSPRQGDPEAATLRSATHSEPETHHSLLAEQLLNTCSSLQQLSLLQVTLCEAGSRLLQSLLPASGLRKFRLTSSSVFSPNLALLVSALSHCPHLEELDMSNNEFDEEDTQMLLMALKDMCWLRRLDLSYLPLGSSSLPVLTQGLNHMTCLQSLRLGGAGLGDSGCLSLAEALRAATNLEELSLSQNQIGDEGAQHLAALLLNLPELRKMDLSKNNLGPVGYTQVVQSLMHCRKLEELSLQSTGLGPKVLQSLGQALDGHLCLKNISLAQNSLTGSLLLLHKGLPLLRHIDLISCEIDDRTAPSLAASFKLCPALEEILLSWNLLKDQVAEKLAQILPFMGRLKKVDLEKNQITARGARFLAEGLAQGSQVQIIRLWGNPIPPNIAQQLQSQEPRLNFAFFDNQPQTPQDT